MIHYPRGLFVTDDEEVLFADGGNHRVRKIDRNGIITTIAGNGKKGFNGDDKLATSASLYYPSSVFQYKDEIYIADKNNYRIRNIDGNGIITTITGNENISAFSVFINNVFVYNDEVYFTNGKLCKIFPSGIIKTIAGVNEKGFNGDDILATQCKLNNPRGIFVDNDSQIYIVDASNHCIRRVDQDNIMRRVIGKPGQAGYSDDVPFDFKKFPHIGPKKKSFIKPFPHAYHDLIVKCKEMCLFEHYEPATKKIKY